MVTVAIFFPSAAKTSVAKTSVARCTPPTSAARFSPKWFNPFIVPPACFIKFVRLPERTVVAVETCLHTSGGKRLSIYLLAPQSPQLHCPRSPVAYGSFLPHFWHRQ